MRGHALRLLLLAAPLAAAAEPGTTWRASLDGTARPEFSLSVREVAGNAELVSDGRGGGALRLSASTSVRFAMDKTAFPVAQGRLEFRLKPAWPASANGHVPILSARAGRNDYLSVNVQRGNRFGAAMQGTSRGAPAWGRVDAPPGALKRGRWHRVAVAWDASGLALFLDGRQVGKTGRAAPLARAPKEIYCGGAAFLIDDLRLSCRRPPAARPAGPRLFEPEGAYRLGFALPDTGPPIRLFVKHYATDPDPAVAPARWGGALDVRLARGEFEPATFVICAAAPLSHVEVEVRGVAAEVRRVVRAPMRRIYAGRPDDWEIVPRFLPRFCALDIPRGEFREIWLTFHAARDAPAGVREGAVVVRARGVPETALPLKLTIRPFELPPDPAKRMGMYYRGAQRLLDRERLETELADLHAHGVTDLVLDAGVDFAGGRADTGVLERLLRAIDTAGITGTMVVQDGLDRLARRLGDPADPRVLPAAREGARLLRAVQQRFPRQRLAVTHMDEVFNRNRFDRYVALAEIARKAGYPRLYITFHTRDDEADRLRARIDPFVDIRGHHGFTFEWWLARGHTMAEYEAELRRSGDEAWIYHNVRGSFFPALFGRLVNGLYLRASPFVLNAPWIYQSYGKNPYDDTDDERHDFGFAFPEPGGGAGVAPTRVFECLREGNDDCRYLHLLERLARKRGDEDSLRFLDRLARLVREAKPAPPADAGPGAAEDGPLDLDTGLRFGLGRTGTRAEAPLIDALSRRLDGPALDRIRDEAARRIEALLGQR